MSQRKRTPKEKLEIVRPGWTPFWTRYGAGRYAEEFLRADADSREKKVGLWAE